MRKSIIALAALAALALSGDSAAAAEKPAGIKNIVLVHGAWADGSGWRGVYDILTRDGYTVNMVANPLTTLAEDVAATDRVLERQDGPVILVGHSYGGAVITEAGDHPKVAALVYVAAFVPDKGESTLGLLPKDGPQPPLEFTADGYAFFEKQAFIHGFASGIDPAFAAFLEASQVPIALKAGTMPLSVAAWKDKPSYYSLATGDMVIPPAAQRLMAKRAGSTVEEVEGGHLAFIANPAAVAKLIEKAARETKASQ